MAKKWESNKEYTAFYNSKENMWRPAILKTDLNDNYISAIRMQAVVQGIQHPNEGTISRVISRYIKEGLAKDGRIKEAVTNGVE
jgi:hypothetical protein|tara:strand:- start:4173 stop:4424 length:252 start_codon:yes stop_codon:yes gene_type:complete